MCQAFRYIFRIPMIFQLNTLMGFFLLCTSCVNDHQSANDHKTIHIDKSFTNLLTLDSIIADYSLIELETNEASLIGTITLMEYLDNRFYVADCRSNTLIVFDTCGKYIYKLTSVGRGPYGFSDIYDFKVDNNHNLYVLSGFRGIVKFDSTGAYISSTNYNTEARNYAGAINAFALTGTGDFYLWNGSVGINKDNYAETFYIYRFTKDRKITKSYLPIRHGFRGSYKIFYGSEGNYLLQSLPGNDTIYRADHSGISPAYYVDFGKTKIPKNSLPSSYENYLREYYKLRTETNFSTSINSPLETETFIYFQFMNSLTTRSAFYSFSTGKVITGTLPFRDILGWPSFNCTFNNKLVGYIEPSKISSISSEKVEKFSRLEKEIYNKLLKTDLNNNPILLILQIKNF